MKNVAVIGFGNTMRTDDGFGIHAVRALKERQVPENVEIVEAHEDEFLLIDYLRENDHVIVVDAVNCAKEPGTVVKFSMDSGFRGLHGGKGTHDFGISKVIDLARELDIQTGLTVVGVVPVSTQIGDGLTQEALLKVNVVVDMILELLRAGGSQS